jgi:hypothetical protein
MEKVTGASNPNFASKSDLIFGWLLFLLPFIVLGVITNGEWGPIMLVLFLVRFMYGPIIIGLVAMIIVKILTKFKVVKMNATNVHLGLLFCLIMLVGFVIIHEKSKNTSPYCQYVKNILSNSEIERCK